MQVNITVTHSGNKAIPVVTRGIKDGRRPNNGLKTVGGSNGSFVQIPPDGKADVVVTAELPGRPQRISIGNAIRDYFDTRRLTKKLRQGIVNAAPKTVNVEIDGQGHASISEEDRDAWFSSVSV